MGLTAMTVATACYIITALDLILASSYAMGIVYAAYATANCGLVWATDKFRLELQEIARQIL
jgi:hypothetical protein